MPIYLLLMFIFQIDASRFFFLNTLTAEIWKIYESSTSFQDLRITFLVFSKYSSRFFSSTWAIVSHLFRRKITSFGLKLTISSIEFRTLEIIRRSWNVFVLFVLYYNTNIWVFIVFVFLKRKMMKRTSIFPYFFFYIKSIISVLVCCSAHVLKYNHASCLRMYMALYPVILNSTSIWNI